MSDDYSFVEFAGIPSEPVIKNSATPLTNYRQQEVGKATTGVLVNERNAYSVAAYWACARAVAEDIAKMRCVLYEWVGKAGKDKQEAEEDPLYTVLGLRPNREMSAFNMWEACLLDAQVGGNGYLEILRDGGGQVRELWPIPRYWITPKRDDGGRGPLYYEFSPPSGGSRRLPPSRVFHLRGPGDGTMGWSVLNLARETIGGALAQREYANQLFGRGGKPMSVLEHPGQMDDEGVTRLRESWADTYGGPSNWGRPLILEEGMKYTAISMNPEEAQFLQTQNFSVEEICRWFRVPLHKVQSVLRVTLANAEQLTQDYINDSLLGWITRIEQEIQLKLVPETKLTKLFARFNMADLLRGDMNARGSFFRSMFNIGVMNENEIRHELDLNGIGPNGDVYYIPANMTPIDIAVKGPAPKPVQSGGSPEEKKGPPDPDPVERKDAEPAPEDATALVRHLYPVLVQVLDRLAHAETEKITRAKKKEASAGGYALWLSNFKNEHESHVAMALQPSISALCSAIGVILGVTPDDTEVQKATAYIAKIHCQALGVAGLTSDMEARAIGRYLNGQLQWNIPDQAFVKEPPLLAST